jgi:hypothetical protein
MKKIFSALTLSTALLLACNTGGSDNDGGGSTEVAPGVTVDGTDFSAEHTVGTTDCPQDVGSTTVKNNSDADVYWGVGETHAALNTDQSGGVVEMGGEQTITISFDCSQTDSFEGTVVLTFMDTEGMELGEASVTVDVNISGG